jgi:hypothetical protein
MSTNQGALIQLKLMQSFLSGVGCTESCAPSPQIPLSPSWIDRIKVLSFPGQQSHVPEPHARRAGEKHSINNGVWLLRPREYMRSFLSPRRLDVYPKLSVVSRTLITAPFRHNRHRPFSGEVALMRRNPEVIALRRNNRVNRHGRLQSRILGPIGHSEDRDEEGEITMIRW